VAAGLAVQAAHPAPAAAHGDVAVATAAAASCGLETGPGAGSDLTRMPARTKATIFSLAGVVVLAGLLVLASRWFLYTTATGADFLAAFPGSTGLPHWAPKGLPVWLEWQHFLNAFFIVLVIRTGWMVRTRRRPVATWSSRSGSTRISIEAFTHLGLDLLWIANGVVFIVLIFCTGQWVRIVPTSWAVVPNAISAALQYLSLNWPTEDGWVNYNSLQLLSYFAVVFIAAPLAAVTGLRMSPLWPSRARGLSRAYPMGLARAVHFPVMLFFVAFVIVHVGLVLSTGALRNLNHMYGNQDAVDWWGFGVFLLSVAVMALGWLLIRPVVMRQVGSLFGKVGR
jgi:thiosulfate reductase cytochrome b subunit